ncbi:unnamed protein product, partial [marine sediment metagenome]
MANVHKMKRGFYFLACREMIDIKESHFKSG